MTQSTPSINELKSYTEYNVSTPTSVFPIGFQYDYYVDGINVYVDGIEATAAGYSVQYDSQGTVTLTPAVPSGVVLLQRETNVDGMVHTFSAGAKFTAGAMDENFKQLRHAQQEVRDETTRTVEQFTTLEANATAALNAANTAVNTANSIDAKATTALANSNTAVSTANAANSTANTALSTANGIDAKATQAQQDASAALSTVSTQKGEANGIATLDVNAQVPVAQLPTARTTTAGLIQIATQTEVNTGLNTTKAVVPNTLLGGMKTHLNASGSAPIYACRAWVHFNGEGIVSVIDSGNVSSITDNGVGKYVLNFTTPMPNANYSISSGMSDFPDGTALMVSLRMSGSTPQVKSTSAVAVSTKAPYDNTFFDVNNISVQVFC